MKVMHDEALAEHTSLRVGGKAQTLIEVEPGDKLVNITAEQKNNGPTWVLGFGTNCLISDHGLPGTVILNQFGLIEEISSSRFKVDSGVNWDDFVQRVIEKGLWGLEFTSGIPGGLGAAVAGNIAAYGHKVADVFVEATMLNSASQAVETWDKSRFGFDYRTSVLQLPENKSMIVLDATFELSSHVNSQLEYESALQAAQELGIQPDSLANRRLVIMEARQHAGSLLNKAGVGPWTAGSFFKNPLVDETQIQAVIGHEEKAISREQLLRQNLIHGQNKARVSAAHVLLAAGFHRGQSWGDVRLNSEHILKIENSGHASAQEIFVVIQNIIATVKEKLDITLEPEVRFLGDF
jgi:UDP-N-acetylmuramate dehydrogenase